MNWDALAYFLFFAWPAAGFYISMIELQKDMGTGEINFQEYSPGALLFLVFVFSVLGPLVLVLAWLTRREQ